jgi:hypothetical protein
MSRQLRLRDSQVHKVSCCEHYGSTKRWISDARMRSRCGLEESLRPKRREPAYAADEPPGLEESAQSFLEAVPTALETHE